MREKIKSDSKLISELDAAMREKARIEGVCAEREKQLNNVIAALEDEKRNHANLKECSKHDETLIRDQDQKLRDLHNVLRKKEESIASGQESIIKITAQLDEARRQYEELKNSQAGGSGKLIEKVHAEAQLRFQELARHYDESKRLQSLKLNPNGSRNVMIFRMPTRCYQNRLKGSRNL